MIGVELVESKETRAPLAKDKFQQIWNRTKDNGVLFGCGGFYGNVSKTWDHPFQDQPQPQPTILVSIAGIAD